MPIPVNHLDQENQRSTLITVVSGALRWSIVALAVCITVSAGAADQRRFALVIGHNQGQPGEEELLYAERDAIRVADVLARLGSVPGEDLILLRSPEANAVKRALHTLKSRLMRVRSEQPNTNTMLLVYYSGHAGVRKMHLGNTHLSFNKLVALVRDASAHMNVMIVDACRSGGLTRVKGGKRAKAFKITTQNLSKYEQN